jgi:pentatricopeptide repeat protein
MREADSGISIFHHLKQKGMSGSGAAPSHVSSPLRRLSHSHAHRQCCRHRRREEDAAHGVAGAAPVQAGPARPCAAAAAGGAAAPAADAALQRAPHRLVARAKPGRPAPALRAPQPRRAPRSDHYTYSSVLTARTRRLRLGRSVHAHLVRRVRALPDTAVLRNSLLNLYASCVPYRHGGVDVVRTLFDAMPKRNAVSWNTLFGWYVKTGRPREALELFARMLEDGVRPTPVSYVNVFPAASCDDPYQAFVLYGLLVAVVDLLFIFDNLSYLKNYHIFYYELFY